jgi:hypothetical protein
MKESTAKFVSYNLRPAKQTERRLLLNFLKCVNQVGLLISEYRYVGMGGTMFYDFHLMHRFLGINKMLSLERDVKMYARARFNRPYDFITVKNETVADFLAGDASDLATIFWLDYDDGLGPDITADITSLGTKMKVGEFAFVTVYAQPPGILEKQKARERLEYFQEYIGDFSANLDVSDMENAAFPMTVHRVLMAAFRNAFAAREGASFQPLFQVQYRDSTQMVTVGGCLCPKEHASGIAARVRSDLPFLSKDRLYRIRSLHLTDPERVLFDIAVTRRTAESGQTRKLKSLGFRKQDFDAYRDLIRFLPRYYESII